MWMSFFNIESRKLTFPYTAKSPTLKKRIKYTYDELWNEIDRLVKDYTEKDYSVGQVLYYNLLHCADSSFFVDSESIMWLEEFIAIKRFKIPIANNIDDADYHRIVIFSAIDEEMNACVKDKNGKG